MGGATENTLLSAAGCNATGRYDVSILAGSPNIAEGSLLAEAQRYGVPVEIVPSLQRDISPASDLRALTQLVQALRKSGCQIVHTHASKGGILGRLAGRLANIPIVVHTIHGLPYSAGSPFSERLAYVLLERCAARLADGMLSVTHDAVRRTEEDRIVRAGQCCVARSGMDLGRFLSPQNDREAIRRQWGIGPDDVVFGTIGRIHTGKGQDVIVRIAPAVCARLPHVKFVLIGTGPLKEPLEATVRAAGLSDNVRFVGSAPPDEMPETISALDGLVHVSEREGLARVIMQGLACGLPVISYALDGSPEVIIDRVNGRLVPENDDIALIEAIAELAENQELRASWGALGPEAVDPEFRAETMVEQIDAAYRRLMRRAGLSVHEDATVPPFSSWVTNQ
jgi:glycosyltransferase involved in cell wall biosynthesis